MKVLTVLQPWASLIMHGLKHREYRRWYTAHRGPLAIHAGRRCGARQRRLCNEAPINDQLQSAGIRCIGDLPLGCILGAVTVTDCDPVHGASELLPPTGNGFAWRLMCPLMLPAPIPYCGQLGLCTLPDEIARILAELFYPADVRELVGAAS